MSKDLAIEVNNLSKTFKLPLEKNKSIKSLIISLPKHRRGYEIQEALKNVSFNVKKGEFFGIVGKNGSGKSTLLKILSGIYTPSEGHISVNGKLTPFIELGVGFNPELTGRENVFLNGALLGFSRKEMAAMYDDIVEFAEIERFMDQKLKNYSSGMHVRLAFSIAIRVRSDILILDEVLAVGDEAFQRKCSDFFDKIKKDKTKTIILVTHSMGDVKKYCTSAILLKNGKLIKKGNPEDVANAYSEENLESQDLKKSRHSSKIRIVPVGKTMLTSEEIFKFKIEYEKPEIKTKLYLAYSLIDIRRGGIPYDSGIIPAPQKKDTVFNVPLKLFNNGEFRVVASLRKESNKKEKDILAYTDETSSCMFSIRNKGKDLDDYALLKSLN